MSRVAEFLPTSGSTGFILLKQGFVGGWTYYYSKDGSSRGAVPLDAAAVAAYDVAGQLRWYRETALLSPTCHERQVPVLAYALAKQAGLAPQVPRSWTVDTDSAQVIGLIQVAVFFFAGGLMSLALVSGVLHLMVRRAYRGLLELTDAGALRLPDGYRTALERRRRAALVSGITDIVLAVVVMSLLAWLYLWAYTAAPR